MAQAISTRSLTKKFGRREVLHGVDFTVEKGSSVLTTARRLEEHYVPHAPTGF